MRHQKYHRQHHRLYLPTYCSLTVKCLRDEEWISTDRRLSSNQSLQCYCRRIATAASVIIYTLMKSKCQCHVVCFCLRNITDNHIPLSLMVLQRSALKKKSAVVLRYWSGHFDQENCETVTTVVKQKEVCQQLIEEEDIAHFQRLKLPHLLVGNVDNDQYIVSKQLFNWPNPVLLPLQRVSLLS